MRDFWREQDDNGEMSEKDNSNISYSPKLLILREKERKGGRASSILECLYTSFHQYHTQQKSAEGDHHSLPSDPVAVGLFTCSSFRQAKPRSYGRTKEWKGEWNAYHHNHVLFRPERCYCPLMHALWGVFLSYKNVCVRVYSKITGRCIERQKNAFHIDI